MIVLSDRIKETSHSVGTAAFVLEGAAPGFSAFGDFYSTGAVVYYAITDGSDYEVGSGQYVSGGTNTITRFPFDSSDSDGLVTFGAGLKEVFVTYPGKYSVFTAAGMSDFQEPAMSGLAFWGSRQVLDYNSNLVWNTADSKLGILTNNPQYALDIGGAESDSIIRSSGMIVGDSGIMFSGVSATGGRQIEPFLRTLLSNDTGTDAVFTLSGIVDESLLFQKQVKGSVLSGPPSGCTPSECSPAYPTFRYLVLEDIPDLSTLYTRQDLDGVEGNVLFYKTSGVHEYDPYFTWKKASNRLGLVVTDPQYTLDIDGTAGISGAVQISGVATFGNTLNVSGNLKVDNNVGIGIANPQSSLHIHKPAESLSSMYLEMLRLEVEDQGVDMNAGHGPGITFYVGETDGSDWGGTIAVVKEDSQDVYSDAAMVFHTSTDDQVPGIDREKMRITSLGSVGIGTTNPQAQLHVAQSGMFGSGVRITENLLVSGNLYNSGDAIIDGNLTVHGTLDAHVADFKVSADTMTLGDTSSDVVIYNASTASIPNNVHFSGGNIHIGVIGNESLGVSGTLHTSGNVTFSNNLSVHQDVTVSGALNTSGIATFANTLNTSGNVLFNNDLQIAGDVGIGTSAGSAVSPASPLHIYKAATTASTPLEMLRLESVDEGVDMNIGHGPAMTFYVGETSGSDHGGTIAVVREIASDADSASAMVFHTAIDDTTPAERMRITSVGDVGIGTTSPEEKFHVIGNTALVGNTLASGDLNVSGNLTINMNDTNGGITVVNNNDNAFLKLDAPSDEAAYIDFSTGANNDWQIGRRPNSNDLTIYDNDGATDYIFTWQQGGNVGIGTTAPEEKFHVVGNTVIAGNTVASGNLTVNNDFTVSGVLNSSGTFNASGNAFFGADVTFGGALNTNSTLNTNNTLNATGALNVSGIATFGNALNASGNAAFGSSTTFGADAAFHSDINIGGDTVATGTLGVSGLVTLNGGLSTYSGGISSNTVINSSGYMVVPGYVDEAAVIAAWPPSTPHSGILVVGGTSLMWCNGTNWLSGVLA